MPEATPLPRCVDRVCQAELTLEDQRVGVCSHCGSMVRNVSADELEDRSEKRLRKTRK